MTSLGEKINKNRFSDLYSFDLFLGGPVLPRLHTGCDFASTGKRTKRKN